MIVYKITNIINNKIYIGCTSTSLELRFSRHWARRFDKTIFARALQKYGKDAFVCEKVEGCPDLITMYDRERFWISHCGSDNQDVGYNLSKGGQGGPSYFGADHHRFGVKTPWLSERNKAMAGKTFIELYGEERAIEIKRKISERSKNKTRSDEAKKKCSLARKLAWKNGKYDGMESVWSRCAKGRISAKRVPVRCVNNGKTYESQAQAGKELGVAPSNISSILSGRLKQTKGYAFEQLRGSYYNRRNVLC